MNENNAPVLSVLEQLRQRAASRIRKIVLPETEDERVLAAAEKMAEQKLAIPVLVNFFGDVPPGVEVIDLENDGLKSRCAERLFENRKHKGLSIEAAELALDDPLLAASTLVSIGMVDGCVAGSVATTANVIRAGLYGIGMRADTKIVSSFFLMQLDGKCLTYADCGVMPDPNAQQLAEIAIASAESHRALVEEEPLVALLSFSTRGSAEHDSIDKVRNALAIVRKQKPDLKIDGELQFDAAFVESVANRKAPDSAVAGKANVFIFPDLNSGNIAYKITERLAGATALGPLIQGLKRPCMDLSRGCSADDIVDVAVIASVLSGS